MAIRRPTPSTVKSLFALSLLGVEVRHVRRLVHERRIPFIKWGHLLRFDPADVEAWIDSHRHGDRLTPPVPLASRRRPALAEPPRDS